MRRGAVQRPRVQHQGPTDTVLLGNMSVTVTDQVKLARLDGVVKLIPIVTVEQRNAGASQEDRAESIVAGLTGSANGIAQQAFIMINIAEHKVRRPVGK